MTKNDFQIEELLQQYPRLSCVQNTEADGLVLHGVVRLDAENNGRDYLVRDIPIRIEVLGDYPCSVPRVWVEDQALLEGYEHLLDDGSLCLGAMGELALGLQRDKSLLKFVNEIVIGNLYSIEYYRIYGSMPTGERSHGALGILEAYQEMFDVDDADAAVCMLACVAGIVEYRGHLPCPCGSGLKARYCHGKALLEIINGSSKMAITHDLGVIRREFAQLSTIKKRKTEFQTTLNKVCRPTSCKFAE